jgi:LmbE family N-acetylglucosaminyl deacetylase
LDETPQRVLVVTPHPNDAEVWCGGTIAKWSRQGAKICYLLCTDGDKNSDYPAISTQESADIRIQEQIKAAKAQGVTDVIMLHRLDGELEDTADFRKEIVRQIRRVRPEVILCPEPYRVNLAWHRDQRITGQVTLDAVFPYARDHLHFPDLWQEEKLEPHKTGTVLFWGTELPDTCLDITSTIDLKIAAVLTHGSQASGYSEMEIVQLIRERAITDGVDRKFKYGERFRKISFRT